MWSFDKSRNNDLHYPNQLHFIIFVQFSGNIFIIFNLTKPIYHYLHIYVSNFLTKRTSIFNSGDLLCRTATHPRANINEAKEYFHRAIQNGRQIESHQKLAFIYKEENNFSKAIEMLEHSLQYKSWLKHLQSKINLCLLFYLFFFFAVIAKQDYTGKCGCSNWNRNIVFESKWYESSIR